MNQKQKIDLLLDTIDELEELFEQHKCPRLTNTKETVCGCTEVLSCAEHPLQHDHWKYHIIFEDYFHAFEHIYRSKELIKNALENNKGKR